MVHIAKKNVDFNIKPYIEMVPFNLDLHGKKTLKKISKLSEYQNLNFASHWLTKIAISCLIFKLEFIYG